MTGIRSQFGAEAIRDVLREEIISGKLNAGESLLELELAARLGVSRTPIREALRLLVGEQLIERKPAGGFRVASLDPEDIKGIYEVRTLLEGLLAKNACHRLTADDLEELRRLIDRMSVLKDYDDEVIKIGREFHGIIERAAGNRWCLQALQQIRGHIDRYRNVSTRVKGRSEEALREHEAIFEALAARDADAAEEAMRAHVMRGGESTLGALR